MSPRDIAIVSAQCPHRRGHRQGSVRLRYDQVAFDAAYDGHGGDPWASRDSALPLPKPQIRHPSPRCLPSRTGISPQGLDLGSGLWAAWTTAGLTRGRGTGAGYFEACRGARPVAERRHPEPWRFDHGDIRHIPASLDGCFDLCHHSRHDLLPASVHFCDSTLKALAMRVSRLLMPGPAYACGQPLLLRRGPGQPHHPAHPSRLRLVSWL